MEYSEIILSYLKDPSFKSSLNPINHYALRILYDKKMVRRSRYFSSAISKFLETLGNTLEISIFDQSIIEVKSEENKYSDDTLLYDLNLKDREIIRLNDTDNFKGDNLNFSVNKNYYNNFHNYEWSIDILFESDEDYILDKEDDYILLVMLKNYIFSDENPKTSPLLVTYNIYCSSIELIFCLKLIEKFPTTIFNPRENKKFKEYKDHIQNRINNFFNEWYNIYHKKYHKNPLIQAMIGKMTSSTNENSTMLDLITLSMLDPILNKNVSFTQLIKQGPFCYEIEELARQICIIDHEYFESIKIHDYNKFIVRRKIPESFKKLETRIKQFKCYILLYILMQNNLDNKKLAIQNFIELAFACKRMNNTQTSFTIISALNVVEICKKTNLLWRLIDRKYKEMFAYLDKEFFDIEMNEDLYLTSENESFLMPFIPHVNQIKNCVNNFIIQLKGGDIQTNLQICKQYKEFNITIGELRKNKYSFFKLNPLYDFLKFGFLEFFKPKKWNIKLKIDISEFGDEELQGDRLDKAYNYLITKFKSFHN
jgi:hypothetical protein